jgi:hypothetical protein
VGFAANLATLPRLGVRWRPEASLTQQAEPLDEVGATAGWTLPILPASAVELPHCWYVTALRAR